MISSFTISAGMPSGPRDLPFFCSSVGTFDFFFAGFWCILITFYSVLVFCDLRIIWWWRAIEQGPRNTLSVYTVGLLSWSACFPPHPWFVLMEWIVSPTDTLLFQSWLPSLPQFCKAFNEFSFVAPDISANFSLNLYVILLGLFLFCCCSAVVQNLFEFLLCSTFLE